MKHKYVVFLLMLSCVGLCGIQVAFMGLPKLAPHAGNPQLLRAASSQTMPASLRGVTAPGSLATPRIVDSYGRLPLSFERNDGQTDSEVKFLSRGRGYTMFLTQSEAVLALRAGNQKSNGKGQNWKTATCGVNRRVSIRLTGRQTTDRSQRTDSFRP